MVPVESCSSCPVLASMLRTDLLTQYGLEFQVSTVFNYLVELAVELHVREGRLKLFLFNKDCKRELEGGKDFGCDFEKVETEMDALHFIIEMLSESSESSESSLHEVNSLYLKVNHELTKLQKFMLTKNFRAQTKDERLALIEGLRLTGYKVGDFMSKIVRHDPQFASSASHDLVKHWNEILDLINGFKGSCNYLKQTEAEGELDHNVIYVVMMSLVNMKGTENFHLEEEELSEVHSQALLLIKGIPALGELKTSPNKLEFFLIRLSIELGNLPALISKACEERALALVLIGSHLSLKERAYHTWYKVKEDLCKIKESDNRATNNHMWHIFTYCYDDIPYSLKQCFLYLACYPIGYQIPAVSLTKIWIAEQFVEPAKEETMEDTANNYLEQLVQRSLVWVSRRSFSGTIKYCQVPRSIHEFIIQQAREDVFLVANPDQEKAEYLFRLALNHDGKNQYTEVQNNYMHSFLAFDFHRNILGSAVFLRVLELRNSAVPERALLDMHYLRYLGLRGSTISEIPANIGDMIKLQTLDVRDTCIQTLPESLWNIKTLLHVYANPSPQIKGPPSTANIFDLQILKTIVASKSWLENIPYCLTNLRKLGLCFNSNKQEWSCISNLLSHMVNLLSLAIIGDSLSSDFVDTRAYPCLVTVKSLKFEGKWIFRNFLLDYVEFPRNLTKLTLIKSGLKKDPMPTLEKLQALRFLSLQDGAYTGNQMVCSANGFPQLQFLRLWKLENLVILEVERTAMPQLATLHVVECPNLNISNLENVKDKVRYN